MNHLPPSYLLSMVLAERERQARDSARARAARLVRRCCQASTSILARLLGRGRACQTASC